MATGMMCCRLRSLVFPKSVSLWEVNVHLEDWQIMLIRQMCGEHVQHEDFVPGGASLMILPALLQSAKKLSVLDSQICVQ